MRFYLFALIIITAFVSACSALPYMAPCQIEEPPIIAPVIDRPVIEPPSQEQPGVPEHSDALPEATTSLRICRRDDECTKVKADCCGCTAGGQAAAVNKEYVASWTNTLNQKCREIACPAVMSNHWTCMVEPKCVKNKCSLIKPA